MKVLHYFLGFPPYRTGGMTKFAIDLMKTQVECGYDVIGLWPSSIKNYNGVVTLKKGKYIDGVKSVEIINPLPVPLMDGILDIQSYTKSIDGSCYKKFFLREKPDIIHIHTLMGLHYELLEEAKILGIPILFTPHDFFGICPKVTLFKNGSICIDDHNCYDCNFCNQGALSLNKIKILQSGLYRNIKNNRFIAKLRKINRSHVDRLETCEFNLNKNSRDYKTLRSFYLNLVKKMDYLHFNSELTKTIYSKYIDLPKNYVISISHKSIENHFKISKTNYDKVRILYLSPAKKYKGFDVLIHQLDKLYEYIPGKFELKMYSYTNIERPYLNKVCDSYKTEDLEEIFKNGDITVTPSCCYETFGYTVLESLSYRTPVVVSNRVGAQSIVGDCGVIYNTDEKNGLLIAMKNCIDNLEQFNKNCEDKIVKDWENFFNEMDSLYQQITK